MTTKIKDAHQNIHDDYRFLLECGCEDWSASLGIQSMPEGYALMLNADRSHFFWVEKSTGRESAISWNKWAVRRGAIEDQATRP